MYARTHLSLQIYLALLSLCLDSTSDLLRSRPSRDVRWRGGLNRVVDVVSQMSQRAASLAAMLAGRLRSAYGHRRGSRGKLRGLEYVDGWMRTESSDLGRRWDQRG